MQWRRQSLKPGIPPRFVPPERTARSVRAPRISSQPMPKITVLPDPDYAPEGAVFDVCREVPLCDALHDERIDIDHACGKVGACTTCHVVVAEGYGSLSEVGENEEDMLDGAWGLHPHSRLACHARVGDADLVVEIPKHSVNHAKEDASS